MNQAITQFAVTNRRLILAAVAALLTAVGIPVYFSDPDAAQAVDCTPAVTAGTTPTTVTETPNPQE